MELTELTLQVDRLFGQHFRFEQFHIAICVARNYSVFGRRRIVGHGLPEAEDLEWLRLEAGVGALKDLELLFFY